MNRRTFLAGTVSGASFANHQTQIASASEAKAAGHAAPGPLVWPVVTKLQPGIRHLRRRGPTEAGRHRQAPYAWLAARLRVLHRDRRRHLLGTLAATIGGGVRAAVSCAICSLTVCGLFGTRALYHRRVWSGFLPEILASHLENLQTM